ncbi:MAG: hypothetical protein J1F35_07240 [Erysipelotrichales bacterium]|nr:hypothetical protein [Erysipelotrichales bacterium]
MNDEYNELYNMLSTDRDEVRKIKDAYQQDISLLVGKIRSYHINNVDISTDYDLENNFDKFKVDDSYLRYKLNNDAIEYKISLLEGYLADLFAEKKFNNFRREKEEKLTKSEYLEYTHNPSVKSDKIAQWYQEFMQK